MQTKPMYFKRLDSLITLESDLNLLAERLAHFFLFYMWLERGDTFFYLLLRNNSMWVLIHVFIWIRASG